jgi:hypothetical protein
MVFRGPVKSKEGREIGVLKLQLHHFHDCDSAQQHLLVTSIACICFFASASICARDSANAITSIPM